jgi:hypothetical protein
MCQLNLVKGRALDSNKVRNSRSGRDLAQNAAELVKIHRFRKVEIEASFSATLDVVTRCEAGYGHGFHGSFSFRFRNDIVAVPVWQRDIAQHNVELFGLDNVQRAPGTISRGNVMAEMIQEPG